MILDAQNMYSDAQALTADAASTNIIDHGARRNIGIGEPLCVLITVDVAAAGGGTIVVSVQTDDNAAFSSATTVVSSAAVADTTLIAGAKLILSLPPVATVERYTRLNYDLTTMTGVTVTAELLPLSFIDTSREYYYPIGYTVAA